MDIEKTNVKWSDNLEKFFKKTGERCYCYGYLNKRCEASYSYYRNFIDLPVIILSTALGTLSIGGATLFGDDEATASIFVGTGSIFVGVLSTIGTYFGFAKRAEQHRLLSIDYNKLFRFISIELNLPIEERIRACDMLKIVKEQYERLLEGNPVFPERIIDEFKERFKHYKDVAKPSECNGLEQIVIFKEDNLIQPITKSSIDNTILEIEKKNEVVERLEKINEVVVEGEEIP